MSVRSTALPARTPRLSGLPTGIALAIVVAAVALAVRALREVGEGLVD